MGNDTSKLFFGYGQVFLGIPFAKPPIGERRFSLPEPLYQFNRDRTVHNATYYRPRCWQKSKNSDNLSEDCLYLNVMTPHILGKFPVMVYIHGGTFTTGGADEFHWKGAIRNLVSRGVVIVTIQYRVGFYGFFTTFTEQFPANRGLYDQVMALRWVNEEIEHFGGDSSRITIFGQSAGAISVADLSLSPLARGLFHQLIQSSGSPMQQLETIDNPSGSIHKKRAHQICGINTTDWGSDEKDRALLDCLLKARPEDLVAHDFSGDGINWNVAIDGALLPDHPENLARTRPHYPVLMGDMLEDFALFIPGVTKDITKISSHTNQDIQQFNAPYLDDETATTMSDMMTSAYSNGTKPSDDDHLGWARLVADMNTGLGFSAMISRDAQWHLNNGNDDVCLFTFAHRSLLAHNISIDGWIPVAHGAELPYLWFFPEVWETYNATEVDLAVANYMGGLWTHFAKHGELPIPRAGESMNYLEIGDKLTVKYNWRRKADEVYNKQFPDYLGEFPPLPISDESWTKLRETGEKVIAKWNSMNCPRSAAKNSSFVYSLTVAMLIILRMLA